jgi:hypothetical protein
MDRNFCSRGAVQFRLQSSGKTKQHEPSKAAMAELAADQHVRYIVTVEKVMHPSSSPSSLRLLGLSRAFNARSSQRGRTRSSRC